MFQGGGVRRALRTGTIGFAACNKLGSGVPYLNTCFIGPVP